MRSRTWLLTLVFALALFVTAAAPARAQEQSAGEAFPSASRAAGTYTFDISNVGGVGVQVFQDLTVLGASSVVTVKVQERDPASGKWLDVLSSAATGAGINATGTALLTVYPGIAATANVAASDVVGRDVRISVTVATAASTFSVGYRLLR